MKQKKGTVLCSGHTTLRVLHSILETALSRETLAHGIFMEKDGGVGPGVGNYVL